MNSSYFWNWNVNILAIVLLYLVLSVCYLWLLLWSVNLLLSERRVPFTVVTYITALYSNVISVAQM